MLWTQREPKKDPDVIIGAYTGGSGCCYHVFTFDFANEVPVAVTTLMHTDAVTVTEVDNIPRVERARPTR